MPRSIPLSDLDPNTPVIVGVGQAAERIADPDYRARSEADLAAAAVLAALSDTGAGQAEVAARIDTVVGVRTFEESSPLSTSVLGRPDNMPRAVAARTGMAPTHAVLGVTGGQSPQAMLSEFAREIAAGDTPAVLLFGAEIMSTTRYLSSDRYSGEKPDFSETISGTLEDRGFAIAGLTSAQEARHHLIAPMPQYAILENARRHRLGQDRETYTRGMAELFAPFSEVAATNPYAAAPTARSAAELATVTDSNRAVAEPYNRMMVARDQVNQAAAVVMVSVSTARDLGIDSDRWVFLHGQADVREQTLMSRPDLSTAPAAAAAVRHALEVAEIGLDDISAMDIYSCFPIAVTNVIDPLGIAPDDARGLTLTGGLPFFGGPGNNYSMHGIVEAVDRVRRAPGSYGLVVANGGLLSKTSVGIYSTTPAALAADESAALQAELDARPAVPQQRNADGPAVIESYTVMPGHGHPTAIVIGRLETGRRFIANIEPDDEQMFELLAGPDPIGAPIQVRSDADGNRVFTDAAAMRRRHPVVAPAFRETYEHVSLRRDGHLLEITIDRPDARNALNPAANAELDSVFDAYFADPDLWVAILTGAGDKAFSAGNDLAHTASGAGLSVPPNGFGGLTARRDLPKPVIAAVNGYALGGGLEIALACHLIVADANASFGLPEVRVGLAALAGGLVRLPRAIGPALARDMILTGRRLDSGEALAAGLISRVAPAGGVMTLAREVAAEILAGSPTAVRVSLAQMAATEATTDVVAAVDETMSGLDTLLVSQDTIEGITAFVTKRAPQWRGH